MKKKFIPVFILLLCLLMPISLYAHSGGTDANGGHHDYKNKSGLGSYHYHEGHPAHLHPNGVCPYETVSSSSSSSSTNTSTASSNTSSATSIDYDQAYQAGYDSAQAELESQRQSIIDESYNTGFTQATQQLQEEIQQLQEQNQQLQEQNKQLQSELEKQQSENNSENNSGAIGATTGIVGVAAGAGGGYLVNRIRKKDI